MIEAGAIFAGKFRILRVLGSGGFAVVLEAEHLALGERVALKILRPELMEKGTVVDRFLREARAAVRLKGEHVARMLDVGGAGRGEGEPPYIVMEYLRGNDLAKVLETRGRLPVTTAVDYVLQACTAIAEAHALGIVHRDIKPSNLFLTSRPDGTDAIKVLDFGIAKSTATEGAAGGAAPSLTQTQDVVGTPLYMAPEQMRASRAADPRTDVWGLGVTLYELLAGRPAFAGASLSEIYAMVLQDTPKPLDEVPPALAAVVACCLAKDATQRFPDVRALMAALTTFGSRGAAASFAETGVALPAPRLSPAISAPSSAFAAETVVAASGPNRTVPLAGAFASARTPMWQSALAIVVLLALSVGGFLLFPRAKDVAAATPAVAAIPTTAPVPATASIPPEQPAAAPLDTTPSGPSTPPAASAKKRPARPQHKAAPATPTPTPTTTPEPEPAPVATPTPRGVASSRFD